MLKKFISILFLLSPLVIPQSDSSLILSEIMFYPQTGPNEFIELYNYSETESININGYKIKYSTSNPDVITDAGEGTILPPKSFAVILEGDYPFGSGIYDGLIPTEALVVKISDNSFGTSGMSNTENRPIWLLNAANDTLEAYFYSANNVQTRSDEKKVTIKDSSQTNWANALVANGTPGFANSVTPVQFDLQLASLNFQPSNPTEGDDVTITSKVKNIGTSSADNYSIEIYNDANFDSTADPSEIIFTQQYNNLSPGDSITASTIMNSLPSGNYQIISKVVYALDEKPENNELIKSFNVFPPGNNYNDVVINEIMYAPSSGEPEWVELYNRTSAAINLKKWKFSDAASSVTITNADKFIPANGFIVLTADSSIINFYNVPSEIIRFSLPALNNTGDAIVIKDSLGVLIDSLSYLPSWGGNTGGKSLERISTEDSSLFSSNWGTSNSISKATPGLINSLTKKDFDIAVDDILFNPEFPLQGDTVSISVKVKNPGKNDANFSLQLFEDTNLDSIPDLFIIEIQNLFISSDDSSVFDFSYLVEDLQNKRAFYVNALFTLDQDTTNNNIYKSIEPGLPAQSVVINEIMYAPVGGEPEWIELYNRTNLVINLNSWKINDVFTTPTTVTINQDVFIEPNSFLVLSRSAEIFNFHRFIPSPVFVLSLPTLNNDVDGVVLKDSRGLQMDSVLYSNQWGGTNGYSLERLSVNASSNLPANWGTSFDIEQSTPGRINSLTPKQFDLSVAGMNFNPRFPVEGDDVFVSAFIRNNGSSDANNFNVEFYIDTDTNNVVDLLLSFETGLNLAAGDSVNVTSTSPIQNITSKILAAVRIVYSADEDTLNNYFEKSVEPGFPAGIVLINEVMYNTETGKPEWVELVNVSGDSINIKNWSISDVLTTPTKSFITNDDVFLQPEEYIVIAKDTSFNSAHPGVTAKVFFANFGSLGNTSDGVVIYDFRNGIIDSLFYLSSWGGGRGLSLERISLEAATNESTNWTTSLSPKGSTPGEPNSILNVPDYERNDLVINEIMFDPETDNSEFIEFLNLSNDSVNIGGWEIVDENGNNYRLSQIPLMIPNNSFFLLAADSLVVLKYGLDESVFKNIVGVSSLGLVNTGELILLRDVKGNVIDSIWYSDKWHNDNFGSTKNISLERINPNLGANDPSNWSSSVNSIGATPGNQNSIYTVNPNIESNISVSPNPFSPDNDGFEDFTIINYKLTQATSQVRIKIFDNKGRLVRTLANNQASGSSGSIIFDGLDEDGQTLRIGIYIIFLEAINEGSGVVESMKTVVVVARKL
ncbi:MAG TPA: lamin tail domain-containing protein [Ignavibacteriaceae bacterium]|nr:lamin tail domain-containing protein [Ignavibacteriaceae bacterium]